MEIHTTPPNEKIQNPLRYLKNNLFIIFDVLVTAVARSSNYQQ